MGRLYHLPSKGTNQALRNEPHVVDALYEASQAGGKIDLIIRGICSLRPGVLGLSDNIRERSILGRFLEYSRVYYFLNGGDEEIYCASADWMDRNLLKRNESCFPVQQKSLREQLKQHLELYLNDNRGAWVLHGDGSYERLTPGDQEPICAQEAFLEDYAFASQGFRPLHNLDVSGTSFHCSTPRARFEPLVGNSTEISHRLSAKAIVIHSSPCGEPQHQPRSRRS